MRAERTPRRRDDLADPWLVKRQAKRLSAHQTGRACNQKPHHASPSNMVRQAKVSTGPSPASSASSVASPIAR
jgi:hypothetical protein